jgi:hypothetical protein
MKKSIWSMIIVFFIAMIVNTSWMGKHFQKDHLAVLDRISVENHDDTDTIMERRILDKLFSLPEVKNSNRYIDSFTNHQNGISMRIVQRPERLKKYYIVDAGYDYEERFENYYIFYVWPGRMNIKAVDSYSSELLTLAEWRKRRRHRA